MMGGRIAFSAAITAAATSAVPYALMAAPGTIHTATISATALSAQETRSRISPIFGRVGPQTGTSPWVVVMIAPTLEDQGSVPRGMGHAGAGAGSAAAFGAGARWAETT